MADGVVGTLVLRAQLHYKLVVDLRLAVWGRPVLRTLDLQIQRGHTTATGFEREL